MTATLIFFGQVKSLSLSFSLFLHHWCSELLRWLTSKRRRAECLSVSYRRGNVPSLSAHLTQGHKSRTRGGGVRGGLTASGFSFHLWQMGAVRHSMRHCPLPTTPTMHTCLHVHAHTHKIPLNPISSCIWDKQLMPDCKTSQRRVNVLLKKSLYVPCPSLLHFNYHR